MTSPTAVVVLAAGQGTRMKSTLPKVVHPVVGLSMIGHALRAANGLDPRHVIAVVRHERDTVVAEIERVMPHTLIADQDEIPGTGRAVLCALNMLREAVGDLEGTIVVTSGDVPMLSTKTLERLVSTHENAGHAVTVLTCVVDDPSGYGRLVRDEDGTVTGIVEHKDATEEQRRIQEINAGVYAFDGAFLAQTLTGIGSDNAQGEVYLTDVVAAAAPAGRHAGAVVLDDEWEAQGCNDRIQLAELAAEFNRRICRNHMRAGVTIEDPSSTWIDIDVTIGTDTVVHPATSLRGTTSIGSKCEIGPGTTLEDVKVGDNAHLPTLWGVGVVVPDDTMGVPFSVLDSSEQD